MQTVPAGTWVEVERTILPPEQRAANLPEETRKTPYVLRISGFLEEDGVVGNEVRIRSLIGRVLCGRLVRVNPSYHHDFGDTVPELLTIGTGEENT